MGQITKRPMGYYEHGTTLRNRHWVSVLGGLELFDKGCQNRECKRRRRKVPLGFGAPLRIRFSWAQGRDEVSCAQKFVTVETTMPKRDSNPRPQILS